MKPENVARGTCQQPSVVVVNAEGGCVDHIDDAMSRALGDRIHLVTELAYTAEVADALRRQGASS